VAASEELGLARNLLGKRVKIQGESLKGLIDRLGRNPNEVERMDVPGGISISRECPKTIPEFMKYRMPERDPRRPFRDKPLARIGENLAAFEEMERVALEKFAKANPNSTIAVAYLNAARDARKEIKRLLQESGLMIKVAEELNITGIPMENPVVRKAIYGVLKLINETSEKNDEA
jgi:hypothetical protein